MIDPLAKAPRQPRLAFLELLRALAAQAIVLHHLAFYGPLSDTAFSLSPTAFEILSRYGRFAVQVFFVIGGFLTARGLVRMDNLGLRTIATVAVRRYRRVALPYLVTLLIAVAANAAAGLWMDHDSVSPTATLDSFLAHAFYLQDLLGYPAITAGVWYLAIDFQLVLMTYLVAGACATVARAYRPWGEIPALRLTQVVLGALAIASLFGFNRNPDLDAWAIYFFGSYFLGLALHWALDGRLDRRLFWLYGVLVVVSVVVDWRPRLVVALGTAALIVATERLRLLERWPGGRIATYLGRTSYSLYLIHFPVCLLVNAWLSQWNLSPVGALWGLMAAYLLSQVAAFAFFHGVEVPLTRQTSDRSGSATGSTAIELLR